MSVAEACALVLETVRELSATRAERDSWRLLAMAWMRHAAELTRELEMMDERQYIHRTRAQDDRAAFLDLRDRRLIANPVKPSTEAA